MDPSYNAFKSFNVGTLGKFECLTSMVPTVFYQNNDPFEIGPAMHIIQHYRKCLKLSGSNHLQTVIIQDNLENGKFKKDLAYYDKQLSSKQLLISRTLYYYGFVDDAEAKLKILSKSKDKRVSAWARIYLLFCARSKKPTYFPSKKQLNEIIRIFSETNDVILQFYSLQTQLIFNVRNKISEDSFLLFEKLVKFLEENNSTSQRNIIFELRVARYLFLYFFKKGIKLDVEKYEKHLIFKTNNYLKKMNKSFLKLMVREALRRYLDGRTIELYQSKRFKEGIYYSAKALKIDEFCPRIQLIHAELLFQSGQRNKAIVHFKKARIYGVWERPFAVKRLNELGANLVNFGYEKNLINPYPKDMVNVNRLPIYTNNNLYLQRSGDEDQFLWDTVRKSSTFRQFRGFFDLEQPTGKFPDISLAANFSHMSLLNKVDFRFKSISLQRMAMPYFRSALFGAALKNEYLFNRAGKYFDKIENLRTLFPKIDHLIHQLEQFPYLRTREQNLLIRSVGNLGFTRQAEQLTLAARCGKDKISYLYILNTNIFYRLINNDSDQKKFKSDLISYFNFMPDQEENLRAKFSISAIGMVYFGQRPNLIQIQDWRKSGSRILGKILHNSNFTDFDKKILASRFYRAACYLPYLSNDQIKLNEDILLCEYFARDARHCSEDELLLYRDNLYSTIDSLARIQIRLQNYDQALALYREINEEIDQYDTKILISEGDLLEKMGRIDEAFKIFIKAAHIESPQGKIAWYRAGTLLEKSKEYEEAKECYLNSLAIDPFGIAPVEGLNRISKKLGDRYLFSWSIQNLNQHKVTDLC